MHFKIFTHLLAQFFIFEQQEEQIRKLRKYMGRLENQQKKLQGRLDKTSKMLKDIEDITEKIKKK